MAGEKLSIGDLAAAVVANDDKIRDELKGLVSDMIRHMRHTMRHGDPSAKIALSKQVIPQLLTAINKVDQSESEREEREAYQRLLRQMTGQEPAPEVEDLAPQATPDIPQVAPKRPVKKVAKKVASR